ncbi:MAG: hypothetical protein K2X86_13530 [Cytophagaceae bacterium]|nr:hypothetical protein [Cytophagaceae bacterium]
MKDKVYYLFPFIYFIKTRVSSFQSFVFHLYYEWLPAIGFLFLSAFSLSSALIDFLIYYLLFISFYELGYMLNDYYSVKYEDSPRLRSKALSGIEVCVIAAVRVIVFAGIVYIKELWQDPEFVIFYLLLGIVFLAHNLIRKKEYKIMTFVNLATFRYVAPFAFVVSSDFLILILPSVFLNYVFYRTLSYIESKNLLNLPDRKNSQFKIAYYLMLVPLSILLFICYQKTISWHSLLPLYMNIYYLIFWITFYFLKDFLNKNN